ncbi:MAG: hypothetical protein ACOYJJ_09805 [Anaerovoracaceae bacterium]|jgi:hypothetical protein
MGKKEKTKEGFTTGRVIKMIAFLAIIVLIMIYLNSVFCLRDPNDSEGTFGTFYDLSDSGTKLDGVYIGSSAVNRFFIPTEYYRRYGSCIYDLATAGQSSFLIKNIVKEAVKEQPDMKIILIEIRPFVKDHWGGGEGSIRNVTDSMKYSENWVDTIDTAMYWGNKLNKGSFNSNKMYYYFRYLLYHNSWPNMKLNEFTPNDKTTDYMGYNLTYIVTNTTKILDPQDFGGYAKMNSDQEEILLDLIKYCKTLDQKVIFVASPIKFKPDSQAKLNYVKALIEKNGMTVWDFNTGKLREDFKVDYNHYYYERSHMNVFGAEAYTKYIYKQISSVVELEDHRGDSDYKAWDQAEKKFLRDKKKLLAQRKKKGNTPAPDNT